MPRRTKCAGLFKDDISQKYPFRTNGKSKALPRYPCLTDNCLVQHITNKQAYQCSKTSRRLSQATVSSSRHQHVPKAKQVQNAINRSSYISSKNTALIDSHKERVQIHNLTISNLQKNIAATTAHIARIQNIIFRSGEKTVASPQELRKNFQKIDILQEDLCAFSDDFTHAVFERQEALLKLQEAEEETIDTVGNLLRVVL